MNSPASTYNHKSYTLLNVLSQLAQCLACLAEVHCRVSGLEAVLHRGLDPALSLGFAHALAEEIGIASEILGRCERDRIDSILHGDMGRCRKFGDPNCA